MFFMAQWRLLFYSVERQQKNLEDCFINSYLITDGKQEQRNFDLPAIQTIKLEGESGIPPRLM